MKQQCGNCKWWTKRGEWDKNFGECHGAPPTFVSSKPSGQWPLTKPDDFCGAWSIKVDVPKGKGE